MWVGDESVLWIFKRDPIATKSREPASHTQCSQRLRFRASFLPCVLWGSSDEQSTSADTSLHFALLSCVDLPHFVRCAFSSSLSHVSSLQCAWGGG